MPQPKPKTKRPDIPLAPTPEVRTMAKDNTRVANKKQVVVLQKKPTYKNVEADVAIYRGGKPYSKKDSLEYKKGFEKGLKSSFPSPFDSGPRLAGKIEGINDKRPYKKINLKK
jgi:hypothetical protein